MQIEFSSKAKANLNFWKKSGNKSILSKIYLLIEDIQLHPFVGIGKPEQLKHQLVGRYRKPLPKITPKKRIN